MKRSRKRVSLRKRSNKRQKGGDALVDTLCNQADDKTLDKVPEMKGIINGICANNTTNNINNADNANNAQNTVGGFLSSSGATGMATKALSGATSIATLPMRIAFGALGKITGFNPFDNSKNNNNMNQNVSGGNVNMTIEENNKNQDVSKLVEKLNNVDKRYLGPEIIEELNNLNNNQKGGVRRKTRKNRKNRKSKRSRNKKSLKKKNRK